MLCFVVLCEHCVGLGWVVLCCVNIVLYCIVLYCIVSTYIILFLLNCFVLYFIILYCIAFYCAVFYCIVSKKWYYLVEKHIHFTPKNNLTLNQIRFSFKNL